MESQLEHRNKSGETKLKLSKNLPFNKREALLRESNNRRKRKSDQKEA
jgi:hypothetical protein